MQVFRATDCHRMHSASLVPGLLQTEGYALAVLRVAASLHGLPADDIAEAARARVERGRVIHGAGRRFVVVIEESVLYCQIAEQTPWPGNSATS